ncbi:unnamed protein product, partial [Mesorhabditis spiculigera]
MFIASGDFEKAIMLIEEHDWHDLCGITSPLTVTQKCVHCSTPYVYSFATLEVLPLVEFFVEPGVSSGDAKFHILAEPPMGQPDYSPIQETKRGSPVICSLKQLEKMDKGHVVISEQRDPLPTRYFFNVMPTLRLRNVRAVVSLSMLSSIILCLILDVSTVYGGGLGLSHYCDPVGTQTTTSYGYMSCLSGRLRNVSCSTFEKPETVENHFRCIAPGQTEVQICSCFIGYFGPRCEYRTRPVLQRGPQQPSQADQDGRSGFPTRQGSQSRDFGDEERVWWKDMPVYKMLLFALDIIIFVILISCCRCVFAKFSQRRQMRREMVLRQEENHGREAPRWPLWWVMDEPGPEYSEQQ